MNASFRLISATVDRESIIAPFETLATKIQRRDRCDRVIALQRAIDEHPEACDAYCWAMR